MNIYREVEMFICAELIKIHIDMTINIFVFIDSTSLEKYSYSSVILSFYKSYNQKNTLI